MKSERFVTAKLCLDTAMHIGTGKGGMAADAPVRRTGDGRLFIPGRAVGGSLRTLATRLAPRLGHEPCQALLPVEKRDAGRPCGCTVCQLFGDVHPVDADQNNRSNASRLWIYDAYAAEAKHPTYVRDGVGIDRKKGTAAHNVKFDYETVPPDTVFNLKLRWTMQQDDTDTLLVATLAEWEAGRGQLGGNVARGLGQFHLQDLQYSQTALNGAGDLIAYLLTDHPVGESKAMDGWAARKVEQARQRLLPLSVDDQTKGVQGVAAGFLRIDFTLAFQDFFLTNDPLMSVVSGFDHAPLVEMLGAPGQPGKPVLSGSSLRGALRSHAEKIARTLATNHWYKENAATAGQNFLNNCPACDVLARNDEDALASCDTRLSISDYLETPEEALCLSCRLFGSQRRGSRLWLYDAHLLAETLAENDWKAQDFLAIDRFTAGGLHGAKFDAAPLYKARFKGQIVLHDPKEWELGWLALLLRDLAEGYLTVGFGAAKGYGRLRAEDVTWAVGYLTEEDHALFPELKPAKADQPGLYQLSENKGAAWLPDGRQTKAEEWVKKFNSAITDFERDDNWRSFARDSFFSTERVDDGEFKEGDNLLLRQYGVATAEVTNHE